MMKSKSFIATPPGYTIKEQLEDRGLKQKEFAVRMEMSEKHISKLINGEVLLTTDMALRLEMVLGIPSEFWMNLESIYREKLAKVEAENQMEADIEIALKFPYNQMSLFNWVPKANTKTEKVTNLRKFFEVNRLGLLLENPSLNVFYRRMGENEKADYALMAWVQKAKLEARQSKTSPVNVAGILKNIPQFRKMTKENPEVFGERLVQILANRGVALVFLPHIGGSFLHGATFYDRNKIVLGLTVRGKDADRFWFSFFHEIGHIVLGHINKNYYEKMEADANHFAETTLIPQKEYEEFIIQKDFTEERIIDFSDSLEIDTGIVVGRLQKENYISYTKFNHLKTRYSIS